MYLSRKSSSCSSRRERLIPDMMPSLSKRPRSTSKSLLAGEQKPMNMEMIAIWIIGLLMLGFLTLVFTNIGFGPSGSSVKLLQYYNYAGLHLSEKEFRLWLPSELLYELASQNSAELLVVWPSNEESVITLDKPNQAWINAEMPYYQRSGAVKSNEETCVSIKAKDCEDCQVYKVCENSPVSGEKKAASLVTTSSKTKVSAMALVSMLDAPFMKEWLVYHRYVLGIEHFYLYEYGLEHSMERLMENEILLPWIESGIVTGVEWPLSRYQESPIWSASAIDDCVQRFGNEADWLLMLSPHDFVVVDSFPKQTSDVLATYILSEIEDEEEISVISLPMSVFGMNREMIAERGLVTKNYINRAEQRIETTKHHSLLDNVFMDVHLLNMKCYEGADRMDKVQYLAADNCAPARAAKSIEAFHYLTSWESVSQRIALNNIDEDLKSNLKTGDFTGFDAIQDESLSQFSSVIERYMEEQ